MGYRILYFYKKENTYYRDGRGTDLSMEERKADDPVKLFFCGLPEYYGRKRQWCGWKKGKTVPWTAGQLLRLMQNCCEYVSADACYLEERLEKELAEGEIGYTSGRQRMCGDLIGEISGRLKGIGSILYLGRDAGEREEELPLPEGLLRKLYYFFYLGEKSGQYGMLEENLWREYGMPVLSVKKAEELSACRIGRLLVIDDRQEGNVERETLPRGCVYLDLWSDAGRRAQIEKYRTDIKYMSEYLYLRRNFDGIHDLHEPNFFRYSLGEQRMAD